MLIKGLSSPKSLYIRIRGPDQLEYLIVRFGNRTGDVSVCKFAVLQEVLGSFLRDRKNTSEAG